MKSRVTRHTKKSSKAGTARKGIKKSVTWKTL
jgi:hypothetical protein